MITAIEAVVYIDTGKNVSFFLPLGHPEGPRGTLEQQQFVHSNFLQKWTYNLSCPVLQLTATKGSGALQM